jgi:hypothetical protein
LHLHGIIMLGGCAPVPTDSPQREKNICTKLYRSTSLDQSRRKFALDLDFSPNGHLYVKLRSRYPFVKAANVSPERAYGRYTRPPRVHGRLASDQSRVQRNGRVRNSGTGNCSSSQEGSLTGRRRRFLSVGVPARLTA